MYLENIMLSEMSQTEKDANAIWYHLNVDSKKQCSYMFMQNRKRLTGIEKKVVDTKGKGDGRGQVRGWDWQMQTTMCKTDEQ